jgi:glutathione peroxidase
MNNVFMRLVAQFCGPDPVRARAGMLSVSLLLVTLICTINGIFIPNSYAANSQRKVANKSMSTIYSFKAEALDGKEIDLDRYKGKVVLIVNTASQCGFTPQYAGLEELNKKYHDRGLEILGFPCNQFGHQEPGDSQQIATFCQKNYGVNFQMFHKVDVNGPEAHPLYKYLTAEAPGFLHSGSIKWNFTKFLVDRNGKVVHRYAPTVAPADVAADIEKLLQN